MKSVQQKKKSEYNLSRRISNTVSRIQERRGKKRITFIIMLSLFFVFAFDPIAAPQIESRLIQINAAEENPSTVDILTEVQSSEIVQFNSALALNLRVSPTDITYPGQMQNSFVTTDPRKVAMRNFLEDHSSPMYPYADVFVEEADKYGLDWRLVASISGVESGFGNIVPRGSNNAWGWRGDRVRGWSHFTTWSEGISHVTTRMALGYGVGLTPFQIEATYCPPCAQNPRHEWANGVNNYMVELNYYLEDLQGTRR